MVSGALTKCATANYTIYSTASSAAGLRTAITSLAKNLNTKK